METLQQIRGEMMVAWTQLGQWKDLKYIQQAKSGGPDDGLTVVATEQKKFPNITPRILACTAKWKVIPILRSFGGSPDFQGQDYEF